MKKHIELLGILHIVYSIFGILIGLGFLVFFPSIGLISGEPIAIGVLTLIGTLLGGFFLVFSVPGFIAGIGLLKIRPWARILAIVIACFDMLNIPIGTALGIYTFWVLINDESVKLFEPGQTSASPNE
jgi:hypothetical protein